MVRPLRLGGGRQGACGDSHSQLGRAVAKMGQEGSGGKGQRDS